jgi:hypothetical protein
MSVQALLPAPCATCPFRRTGKAVRLRPARAKEIAANACNPDGLAFWCHEEPNEQHKTHCSGSALFGVKNGNMTNYLRILSRIRMFTPETMKGKTAIFDTVEEMVEANRKAGY